MPTLPYTGDGSEYDVVVGGVPFRLATSQDLPQGLETVDVNKEQLDTERDPGEQSLAGFWRRSQASFHWGAGYLYDNRTSDEEFSGFLSSSNVDPLSQPGEVRLLRDATNWTKPVSIVRMRCYNSTARFVGPGTPGGDIYAADAGLTQVFSTPHLAAIGGTGGWIDMYYNELSMFALTTSTVYKIRESDNLNEGYWSLTNSSSTFQIGYAKYRLWVFGEEYIFIVPSGAPDDGLTPVSPWFTNPQAGWRYTCMAEGPSAVYFGGDDGTNSSIQMITLNSDGSLPTLSGAITAAVLPKGERIQAMNVLGGQFVGIGTSAGFRVGRIETSGSITYGPLLITNRTARNTPSNNWGGVKSVTSFEDSFYVGAWDFFDPTMIYRVDTSTELGELIYPFCRDMETSASTNTYAKQLDTLFGGQRPRLVALQNNGDVWVHHATNMKTSGWLQTSRIRYNTFDPKAFKYATIGASSAPTSCGFKVDYIDQDDVTTPGTNWLTLATVRSSVLTLPTAPQAYLSLKINFIGTTSTGPILSYFLTRALPASKPQRLITLPVLCYDSETTRTGQTYYTKGWSRQRLEALQAFEDTAATLVYSRAETTGTLNVVIDSMQFIQTSPPNPTNQEGAGGILVLKLKTVNP